MLDRLSLGEIPKKHHIAFKTGTGTLHHEECITRAGFDGPYTIVYHEHRPHIQRNIELNTGFSLASPATVEQLKKRHYKSFQLRRDGGSPLQSRIPLLFNQDLVCGVMFPSAPDPVYFSNGDADDLYFIFEGGGVLRTVFGDIEFEANDYVYVPRGTIHRFIPKAGSQYWLSLECLGGMGLLKQWRNEVGQLRMDAPYCHRDFRRPEFRGPTDEGIREVVVKRGNSFHGFASEHTPLDAVGWDGAVYPWVFPILNFQPRAGLVHLPPTWHGTFAARGALICSFVPRVVDFHPEAIPCPYPHSSVDVDEILFYCRGNFTSRKGISPGSVSFHPAGIPHGPHPGAYEASIGTRETDELAVMVDTIEPLTPTPQAAQIEDPNYQDSFV